MARADAETLGLIGSGAQARTQIAAAAAVRRLRTVRVYSRNTENRRAFAEEMARQLDLDIAPVASAREAVTGADIVICATSSEVPVIEAAWLAAGTHINALGPKTRDRHELGLDVAERAGIIATDSPAQTGAYGAPFFLEGSRAHGRLGRPDRGQGSGAAVAGGHYLVLLDRSCRHGGLGRRRPSQGMETASGALNCLVHWGRLHAL
jgi:ornithine cyclodeaminase